MDQSVEGQTNSMEEVWIKNEPIDIESTSYFHIKCGDEFNIVKIETPTPKGASKVGESFEAVDIKSTFGEKECIPIEIIPLPLTKNKKRKASDDQFICDDCGLQFASKQGLSVHQQSHTGKKPYACDECLKTFYRKESLVRHKRFHSGEQHIDTLTHIDEQRFSCDECGMKYATKFGLKMHRRSHTGRPHACDECGKAFNRKEGLLKHKRFHSDGEKSVDCDEFGVKILQKSPVKPHKLTPTGDQRYSCEECGTKFACKRSLIQHKKIHTEDTIFYCYICKVKFDKEEYLVRHTIARHR